MPSLEARTLALMSQELPSVQVHQLKQSEYNKKIEDQLFHFNIVLENDESDSKFDDGIDEVVMDVSSTSYDEVLLDDLFLTEEPIGSTSITELRRLMQEEDFPVPSTAVVRTVSPVPTTTKHTDTLSPAPSQKPPVSTARSVYTPAALKQPKRKVSAYNLFFSTERKQNPYQYQNLSFSDMAKLIGAKWRRVSKEEKKEFERLSELDQTRFDREMKAWKAQQKLCREFQTSQQQKAHLHQMTVPPRKANIPVVGSAPSCFLKNKSFFPLPATTAKTTIANNTKSLIQDSCYVGGFSV